MRQLAIIAAIFAILLLAGCASQPQPQPMPEPQAPPLPPEDGPATACIKDAKLCPDGSYVGRNANLDCEFDPCPPYTPPPQLAKEGEFCGGIAAIQCETGLECYVPPFGKNDTLGVCNKPSAPDDTFHICPQQRGSGCGGLPDPVCGRVMLPNEMQYYRDYANGCEACSQEANAVGYWMGGCIGRGT